MPYVIGLLIAGGLGGLVFWWWRQTQSVNETLPAPESLIIDLPPNVNGASDGRERVIALEAGPNFRDIGGYPTSDGRRVRWGQVYRAGTLHDLTDADLHTLAGLGVNLVCDLRTDDESQSEPNRPLPNQPETVHLPVVVDADTSKRVRTLLFQKSKLPGLVIEGYTRIIIDNNAAVLGAVFKRLADPDSLPAIIHCTAGKDRTGVTIALLLLALGVPEETVVADYSLSNRYYERFAELGERAIKPLMVTGVRVADLRPLLVADPATLRTTFAYIRDKYGSVEAYLRAAAGVTDETIERLKENLLES